MGLSNLKSQAIFLDLAPLIFFMEGNTGYQSELNNFFSAFDTREFSFLTSTLTLLEVLVHPIKLNRLDLVGKYKKILSSASGIKIIEMTPGIAYRAAELRAKYNLKTPDSIQVGTALEYEAQYFLTNDLILKIVKEIKSIPSGPLRVNNFILHTCKNLEYR